MALERNPQAEQMADESMVRNLVAQAEAIWPQEAPLFDRYRLAAGAHILDVGCGIGELTWRLAERFPSAQLLGIDILPEHLSRARSRGPADGRVRFEQGDAFALALPDASQDLALCRHLLQAIPEPERVVAEMIRVTRPGGWVHLVAEDYAMMHFDLGRHDTDLFWHRGPMGFARATNTDLRSGRKMYGELKRRGLEEVRLDWVTLDPDRAPRETFAAIWVAWRDGYSAAIAAHSDLSLADVTESFNEMIAAIRDPEKFAVWHLPVVSGRKPS